MEHMSRERISMQKRLEMIRESNGAVSSDNGFITVCSYSWMLSVRASSVLQCMGLNDFKKMIRVVKSQLDPDYYMVYLAYWRDEIGHFRNEPTPAIADKTKMVKLQTRFTKMLACIQKEEDKLPAYVFEE